MLRSTQLAVSWAKFLPHSVFNFNLLTSIYSDELIAKVQIGDYRFGPYVLQCEYTSTTADTEQCIVEEYPIQR